MPLNSELLKLLACPVNGRNLVEKENTLTTETGEVYPIISGIPWLLPNPQNSLIDWSIKLNHFHQVLSDEIQELEQALPHTSGPTQQRLQQLFTGKQKFLHTVFDLMSPVVRNPMTSKSSYDALSDIAPNTQNLLSYESNLYRDWVWGEEENKMSAEIVGNLINSKKCSKLLVLGAGAGKLALDIHNSVNPNITVATDINPLLVLAAQRITQGDGLTIYEFPTEPRCSEYTAVEHTINSTKAPDNFHTIFSDVTKPAFTKGSFDTVVTPWLIDIQPLELGHFLQQLNQYLSVGDQWINFGSLVFHQNRDALCYSIEEVKTIATAQGFEITELQEHEIPYLKSPYNAGHRVENIWCWTAKKTHDVSPNNQTQNLPDWLRDTTKPIPKAPYFQQFSITHRLYAQLSAEVDGRTSLKKIANKLAKQQRMNPEEALQLVKNLFIDLFRQNN
jgi:uncharacterized protein YbaR (Trm112 family)